MSKIIDHPNFMPALYENDISMLKMESPIYYTPSLLPICLPPYWIKDDPGYADMYVGDNALLSGWGRQWNKGPLSEQLEMVTLPIISNNDCMR